MLFWSLIYVSAFSLTFFGRESFSGKHCIWIRAALVVIVSFASLLQSSNGTDIEGYRSRFELSDNIRSIVFSISMSESKEYLEIGYNLIALLLHKLHIGFSGMLLLTYLFLNATFVHFIYKFKFPLLGIVAFLVSITFFQEINLQRQMIAIALLYLGIEQIEKGKSLRFIYLVLLAVLFHSSALFLLPLYFLRFINVEKYFRSIKLICGILWLFSIFILFGFIDANGMILSWLSKLIGDTHYSIYLSETNDVGMDTDVSWLFQFLMLFVFISSNKENLLYLILFSLGCVFANISTAIPNMVRFAFYFTAFCPLFLAQLIDENFKRRPFNLVAFMYCGYYFLYRVPISISSRSIMLPDYSVLQGFIQ